MNFRKPDTANANDLSQILGGKAAEVPSSSRTASTVPVPMSPSDQAPSSIEHSSAGVLDPCLMATQSDRSIPVPSTVGLGETVHGLTNSALLGRLMLQEQKIRTLKYLRQRLNHAHLGAIHSAQNPSDVLNIMIAQQSKNQTQRQYSRFPLPLNLEYRSNLHGASIAGIPVNIGGGNCDHSNDLAAKKLLGGINASTVCSQQNSLNSVLLGKDENNYKSQALADNEGVEVHHKRSPSPLGKQKGRPSVFPRKLYKMLSDLEEQPGGSDIASFLPNGRAFKVHNIKQFVEEVIPKYFSMSSMASFQRQLRMYNFQQIQCGSDMGAYYNELFVRGKPELCTLIKRTERT